MSTPKLVVIDPQLDWACEACDGTVEPMGVLGTREHGRCRACGLDASRSLLPTPTAPIDPEDQILRDEEGEPFANDWKPQP